MYENFAISAPVFASFPQKMTAQTSNNGLIPAKPAAKLQEADPLASTSVVTKEELSDRATEVGSFGRPPKAEKGPPRLETAVGSAEKPAKKLAAREKTTTKANEATQSGEKPADPQEPSLTRAEFQASLSPGLPAPPSHIQAVYRVGSPWISVSWAETPLMEEPGFYYTCKAKATPLIQPAPAPGLGGRSFFVPVPGPDQAPHSYPAIPVFSDPTLVHAQHLSPFLDASSPTLPASTTNHFLPFHDPSVSPHARSEVEQIFSIKTTQLNLATEQLVGLQDKLQAEECTSAMCENSLKGWTQKLGPVDQSHFEEMDSIVAQIHHLQEWLSASRGTVDALRNAIAEKEQKIFALQGVLSSTTHQPQHSSPPSVPAGAFMVTSSPLLGNDFQGPTGNGVFPPLPAQPLIAFYPPHSGLQQAPNATIMNEEIPVEPSMYHPLFSLEQGYGYQRSPHLEEAIPLGTLGNSFPQPMAHIGTPQAITGPLLRPPVRPFITPYPHPQYPPPPPPPSQHYSFQPPPPHIYQSPSIRFPQSSSAPSETFQVLYRGQIPACTFHTVAAGYRYSFQVILTTEGGSSPPSEVVSVDIVSLARDVSAFAGREIDSNPPVPSSSSRQPPPSSLSSRKRQSEDHSAGRGDSPGIPSQVDTKKRSRKTTSSRSSLSPSPGTTDSPEGVLILDSPGITDDKDRQARPRSVSSQKTKREEEQGIVEDMPLDLDLLQKQVTEVRAPPFTILNYTWSQLQEGMRIEFVDKGTIWYAARISKLFRKGTKEKLRIHYEGWSKKHDEVMEMDIFRERARDFTGTGEFGPDGEETDDKWRAIVEESQKDARATSKSK